MYVIVAALQYAAALISTFFICHWTLSTPRNGFAITATNIPTTTGVFVVSYNKISVSLSKWQLGRAVMVGDQLTPFVTRSLY